MSKPKFSVIIPAYNASSTLRSTVRSVLLQTLQDFEIIVIDDGSTDSTMKVMLDLAGQDQRIRTASKSNSGVSATRNLGAKLAKGDLLAFLDADDEWEADKLVTHLALHHSDDLLDASFAQVTFCPDLRGRMSKSRSRSTVPFGYLHLSDVLVENAICTTSNLVVDAVLFEELGGFDEEMSHAEDQEFLARLIESDALIKGTNTPLVNYRMSEDGLSCDYEAMLRNWLVLASAYLCPAELANAKAIYCRYLTRRALRAGAPISVARDFARKGFASDRKAFLSGGHRSALTVAGTIAGSAIPAAARRALFA